jgi:hypothetical protein
MSVDIEKVERVIERENSRLQSIYEGIVEGISEGVREGAEDGLKRGAKDGLKECLAEDLGNVSPVEIGDVLDGIGEDVVKVAIRESSKNVFKKGAEAYIRRVCEQVVNEVQKQHAELSEEQINDVVDFVTKIEQEAAKRIMEKLPDNPFIKEFADGIQAALEESLESELKACGDRLRQKAANGS